MLRQKAKDVSSPDKYVLTNREAEIALHIVRTLLDPAKFDDPEMKAVIYKLRSFPHHATFFIQGKNV